MREEKGKRNHGGECGGQQRPILPPSADSFLLAHLKVRWCVNVNFLIKFCICLEQW